MKPPPVRFDDMKQMSSSTMAAELGRDFEDGDLHALIDQLQCLFYYVDPGSEKAESVADFCRRNAVRAGKINPQDEITSFYLAAILTAPDNPAKNSDIENFRRALDGIVDKAHACDVAAAMKSRLEPQDPVRIELLDFLMCNGSDEGMLLHLAKQTPFMTAPQIDRLIDRVQALADPAQSYKACMEILHAADCLTQEQRKRTVTLLDTLKDKPQVIGHELQKAYALAVVPSELAVSDRLFCDLHPLPPTFH